MIRLDKRSGLVALLAGGSGTDKSSPASLLADDAPCHRSLRRPEALLSRAGPSFNRLVGIGTPEQVPA